MSVVKTLPMSEKMREALDYPTLVIDASYYKSLHPDEKLDSNNNDGQTRLIQIADQESVRSSSCCCSSGAAPNEIPWLACRLFWFGIIKLFLALLWASFFVMLLCCGAYFSKLMAVIGFSAVVMNIAAAVQTVWQVSFIDSRGTSHVKICLSKMLTITAMGVNLAVVVMAIFYSASEPECRMVNSEGDVLSPTASTPSGGPTCYADFFGTCYSMMAGIIVVGALAFIFGLMMIEKLCKLNEGEMRGYQLTFYTLIINNTCM